MAFDVNAALKDGHSEAAIADYLGRQNKFDVATARKDGYSDKDILGFLNKTKTPEVTKPAEFSAKETAAALGQGIIGAGKSLTDVFGADNAASKFLEEQNKALEGVYSPERKAEMAQRQAKIAEAEKSGDVVKEIGAYLGTIADAPVQSLAQGLGSIVPYIGTGVIGGLAKLGGAAIKALNTVVGAAQGAGTIKGSVYDAVKDELEKGGMKPSEAAEKASKAQEYLGPNALQIMAGTALGGVAARFGVENLLQKGAADKLNAKLIPRVLTAAGAEAPLEGLQGGQEQLAKNLALQQAGFDVPAMQGVFGSAFRDAALGALTAGSVGAVQSPGAKPVEAPITPTGNPPTDSPVASTTTINISGKESIKTTRADGSVEIDGVQVVPPTTTTDTTKDTTKEEPEKTTTGYVPKFDMEGNRIAQVQATKDEDLLLDYEALPAKVTPEIQNIQAYIDKKKNDIANNVTKGAALIPTQNKIAKLEEGLNLINQGKLEEAKALLPQNYIKEFKLEGILNVKPINTTAVGTSAQASGEPGANTTAAGATAADQGGVDVADNVLKGAEVGEGDKSAALTEEEQAGLIDELNALQNNVSTEVINKTQLEKDIDKTLVDENKEPKVQVIPEKVVKRRVSTETKEKQKAMDALAFSIAETKIGIAKGLYTGKALENAQEQVRLRESQLTDLESGLSLNEAIQQNTQRQKDEDAQRLADAPRTQAQINQRRNNLNKLMADTKAEIEADETLTPQEKQTQVYFNNYMNAVDGNTDAALNLLAADLYLGKPFNYNPDAPGTGGEAAKSFRLSLSDANADKLQTKLVNLKNQAMSGGFKNAKKVLALENTEIYGGSTPEFAAAVLRGDLRGALQEIVSDKTGQFTPLDKLISSRLLKDKSLPVINVVEKLDKGYGNYDTGTDVITIREDSLNSHVVLHEALHGFTASLVLGWQSKYIVNGNVTRLNNLYEFLKTNHPEIVNQYAFSDLVEFISEAFSNTNFQAQLSAIPYQKSNVFTEFARRILNLLGISPSQQYTALAEALIATDAIMTTGREFQGTAEGVKKVLNLQAEKEPVNADAAYNPPEKSQPKTIKYFKDLFFTTGGLKRIITEVQNKRYEAKNLQDKYELARKIIYEGDNLNNFYDWLTLGAGRAKNFYEGNVEKPSRELNNAISKLAKEKGYDTVKVLNYLHQYLQAKHEPERRMVKYILTVPLTVEANAEREAIIKELNTNTKMSKEQAQEYRQLLEAIVSKNFDAYGVSPPNTNLKKPTSAEQVASLKDPNSDNYKVTPLTSAEAKATLERFENAFGQSENLKNVIKALNELNNVTKEMNKKSNYWSAPVDNRVNFYGFENYVPLKGKPNHSEVDEYLDYDTEVMGGALIKEETPMGGRASVGENPILRTQADAVQAAMRAGRGVETTLSIKNAILQGIIPGSVNKQKGQDNKPISFDERSTSDTIKQLKENKGNRLILHYNSDGSIDVLEITDARLLESIRETYKKSNVLIDVANSITSTLGKMHTRYNFNFAPLNFVRDALTNAFNIGAKMGPFKTVEFLAKLSVDLVTKGAMNKAFNVARLYSQPDGLDKIKALAAKTKDPIYINMAEYIDKGGMVEYLQGMSIKSNFEELNKRVGKSGKITKVEDFNRVIDIWNNMFEIASRSSAYAVAKSNYMSKENLTESAASTKAATFVKNLANFEQVGKSGKALGAAFMFFRPSATGAVRALEAIAPAFQTLEMAKARLPNRGAFAYDMVAGEKIYKDSKAVAEWEKNYAFEQKSARYMAASLIALGWMMYNMSKMMAPDDDLGRNKTQTDNMDQWNRFARFHFPGTDKVFQIPWGFGLGAFAAAGAQLAAAAGGNGTMGDAMRNIFTQISLDSFVPIPVSRMKFSDDPLMWAVDSALPSFMRPAVEFSVNLNGIGQTIYNDSNRRMGDAYLGGDNIPQVYKEIAEYLNEKTLGGIDWSPNSLYFLTNTYMDGPARAFLELPANLYDLSSNRKDFTPKDVPFVGSFFSSESNIDAREFAEYEKDILKKEKIIKGFEENNPDRLDAYLDKYPFDDMLVKEYRQGLVQLNRLRKEANEIRRDYSDNPKERNVLLKENKSEQNLYKNDLLDGFKSYKD